jgi:hypothetical protein
MDAENPAACFPNFVLSCSFRGYSSCFSPDARSKVTQGRQEQKSQGG